MPVICFKETNVQTKTKHANKKHGEKTTPTYKTELVRQSQIVQSAVDSSGKVVPQVLTPARFTSGLYLPWLSARAFPISSVYVSWLYFHSRSKNYLQFINVCHNSF